MSITTRLSAIIADILTLVLTWSKTWATYREARAIQMKVPLITLLLRDGEVLFCCCIRHSAYVLEQGASTSGKMTAQLVLRYSDDYSQMPDDNSYLSNAKLPHG